jgi:hypothetical protein
LSGFASRLAARARGDAAVARPRRAPHYMPETRAGATRPGNGMPIAAVGTGTPVIPPSATAPAAVTGSSGPEPVERRDARATVEPPVTAPASAGGIPAFPRDPLAGLERNRPRDLDPGAPGSGGRREPVPVPERRTGAPARPEAAERAAAVVVRASVPAPAQTTPQAPERAPAPAAGAVRLVPRPARALPATAAAGAPRIEVRIGRVEVSAPPPATAPPRPSPRHVRAPAQQRPAPRTAEPAFGELAAARRHVDRMAR